MLKCLFKSQVGLSFLSVDSELKQPSCHRNGFESDVPVDGVIFGPWQPAGRLRRPAELVEGRADHW